MAIKKGGKGVAQPYDPTTGKFMGKFNNQQVKPRQLSKKDIIAQKLISLGLSEQKTKEFIGWLFKNGANNDNAKEFNYLDKETLSKLKETQEGRKIIINAPKMTREELESAVKECLNDGNND